MTPFEFTRSVRSLNRLRQIAQVLSRHGFGHIVSQVNLGRHVPLSLRKRSVAPVPTEDSPSEVGRRMVAIGTELGPTFVKLGQLLSTRPDLLPQDILIELRSLQDEVPPFDTDEARAIIEEELGRPIGECFTWFDAEPFASASIGQVYRAKIPEGVDVVVKVRRPGIEDSIRLDMHLLHRLAQSLEEYIVESRIYRPTMIVAELEETLVRELDYINEASVTSRFHEALADMPGISTPRIHWDLCGPRVMTQEALPGVNVEHLLDSQLADDRIDRKLIARRISDCFLRQVFELGMFHADMHPGNILIDPPAKVSLVDFGQVGTISDEQMTELIALVYAMINNEIDVVIDSLADLGALGRKTDRRQLHRALEVLIGKYYGLPIKRFDLQSLFNEFSDIMRRHDVSIPRELNILLKAGGTVSGVTTKLDPELDLLELVRPRLRAALKRRFEPSNMWRGTALIGWDLLNIFRQAPRQIRTILRRFSTAGWETNVRLEHLDRFIRELDRSSNRLSFAVVIAGIIIGSSVVFSAATDMRLLGINVQYFGIVGYLMAAVLGLGLSWAIFRSGRLH